MNYKEIKTWKDACKVHGINPTELPIVTNLPKKFQKWIIATYKMGVIVEAINTNEKGKVWIPNWNDSNQSKYTAWFQIKATKSEISGVGFSSSFYVYWYSDSCVGSRLCFENRDQVSHVQKYFEDIFIEMLLIQK